ARPSCRAGSIGKPVQACKAPSGCSGPRLRRAMLQNFDAYVTAALFDRSGRAAFALGDGTVRLEDGAVSEAHQGAVLRAAPHPGGDGLLTGGDDGRLVWS